MRLRLAVFALVAAAAGTLALPTLTTPAAAQTTGTGLVLSDVSGSLGGGQFTGSVTIARLGYRPGQLVADGTLTGTVSPAADPSLGPAATPVAQPTAVTQIFREAPLTIVDPNGGACDALALDFGPIFLDVPGRQLDLAATTLDLTTATSAQRVRGNLLCAVAGLTETMPTGGQLVLLNEVLMVVNHALSGSR